MNQKQELDFKNLKEKSTWSEANAGPIAEFFGYKNNEAFQNLLIVFIQKLASTNEYGMRIAERAFLQELAKSPEGLEKLAS